MYNGESLTIADGRFRLDDIEIYGWHYIVLVDTESNVRMQFLKSGMLAISNTLDEELIKAGTGSSREASGRAEQQN